ncbi:hypothetical protein ALO82_200105 [Pseudomonas syringae pv. broussonetiae]|nr:hypothetical protein ALO82_200105 [Pseudomonas syringae pv. broussonetiae]
MLLNHRHDDGCGFVSSESIRLSRVKSHVELGVRPELQRHVHYERNTHHDTSEQRSGIQIEQNAKPQQNHDSRRDDREIHNVLSILANEACGLPSKDHVARERGVEVQERYTAAPHKLIPRLREVIRFRSVVRQCELRITAEISEFVACIIHNQQRPIRFERV